MSKRNPDYNVISRVALEEAVIRLAVSWHGYPKFASLEAALKDLEQCLDFAYLKWQDWYNDDSVN
jgi:hypothetical protein